MSQLRLNKTLVTLGLAAARRKADQLIIDGKVSVNGKVVTKLATQVDPNADAITVEGVEAPTKPLQPTTIALHKPVGYVCTHQAQDSSKTVFELLPVGFASYKIAGRLDKDSEGLVILSSNGELVHKLSHPSFEKSKTYEVTLDKPLSENDLIKLQGGVELDDGLSQFDSCERTGANSLRVILHEGRNRQIRRTLKKLGYRVNKLVRTQLANITLRGIEPGTYQKVDILMS